MSIAMLLGVLAVGVDTEFAGQAYDLAIAGLKHARGHGETV
jgi:hypothetical protein